VLSVKLSALVCAHNDEARLADCLRGLTFCDQIVVVADRCTDRTQEIARQFGAHVVDGIFPLESQRKTAGLAACLGEWILEVEPDETVDATLAYEVRAAIHGRPQGDWFDVPVHNLLGGALVRRGWSSGPCAPRLFRRQLKRWEARRIDAFAQMHGRHAGALETPLVRSADSTVGEMISRLDQQTWLRAQDIADAGTPGSMLGAVWRGLRRFARCYILRQGVREGAPGFMIALMAGLDPILSTLRAREVVSARAAALVTPAPLPAAAPARLGRTG